MLRIWTCTSALATQKYYTASLSGGDYDLGEDAESRWLGEGAKRLDLFGSVDAVPFGHLCNNRRPPSLEQLTPRQRADRRVGYDLNFHAPKSVSVVCALTGDVGLLNAVRAASESTMRLLEERAATRVRVDGASHDRPTKNLVWAEFVHETTRPVDGIPDPHLHIHNVVFNCTWDDVEERWKALQIGAIHKSAPFYEAYFLSELAREVGALGYGIRKTDTAWEIEGVSPEINHRFSRRSAEIDEAAADRGINDPAQKAKLGAFTRRSKASGAEMPPSTRSSLRYRVSGLEQGGQRRWQGSGSARSRSSTNCGRPTSSWPRARR